MNISKVTKIQETNFIKKIERRHYRSTINLYQKIKSYKNIDITNIDLAYKNNLEILEDERKIDTLQSIISENKISSNSFENSLDLSSLEQSIETSPPKKLKSQHKRPFKPSIANNLPFNLRLNCLQM